MVCLTALTHLKTKGVLHVQDEWQSTSKPIFHSFTDINGSQLAKMKKSIPDMSLP